MTVQWACRKTGEERAFGTVCLKVCVNQLRAEFRSASSSAVAAGSLAQDLSDDVRRLTFIRHARDLGFDIVAIKTIRPGGSFGEDAWARCRPSVALRDEIHADDDAADAQQD